MEEICVSLSGKTFPKEYFNKIINIIIRKKISYLLIYDLDRLSRDLPYGAYLINKLWELDVQIVTSTFSPDKNKPSDRFMVWVSLILAESGYEGIHEKTRRGIITKLQNGIYFYKHLPLGYERIDLSLILKEGYDKIITDIFSTFIQTKSYIKTSRIINKKYGELHKFKIDGRKISDIISNKINIGFFTYDGLTIGIDGSDNKPRMSLIAVESEIFDKANQIKNIIEKKYKRNKNVIPSDIKKKLEDFGYQTIKDIFPNLKVSCPLCGSIYLRCDGSEVQNGALHKRYICKKCDYHFRFPSGKQLKKIRTLQPLRCMKCGVPDRFDIKHSPLTDYQCLICKECKFETLVKKNAYEVPNPDIKKRRERRKNNRTKKPGMNNKNVLEF